MPSPSAGVLDNFNRSDATTLGSNWTVFTTIASPGSQGIINNTAYNPSAVFQNYTGMYWNQSTFGPNVEEFITINSMPTLDSDGPAMDLRITSPGTQYNSYSFGVRNSGGVGDIYAIAVALSGAEKTLGTASSTAVSGDKLWFTAVGSTLTGYLFHGGSWGQVLQVISNTYGTLIGNIGFYIPGNHVDGRFDDYGGGTIITATSTNTGISIGQNTKFSILQDTKLTMNTF